MLRVPFDEIETSEDSMFLDAVYQGKSFTGIAFEDDDKSYYECPYVNGNAEGRCFEQLKNGVLIDEAIFKNGLATEERSWYPNGQLAEVVIQNPKFEQRYKKDGRKTYEFVDGISRYWYDNGVVREEKNFNTLSGKYYARNGEWLFDMKLDSEGYFVTARSNYKFNDEYIQEHAIELLEEHDFYGHFLNWLPEWREGYFDYNGTPILTDIQKQIIIQMIQSDNPNIKFNGVVLADSFQLKDAIPYIKNATSFHVVPKDIKDEYGITIESSTRSVAEQAKNVLKRFGVK